MRRKEPCENPGGVLLAEGLASANALRWKSVRQVQRSERSSLWTEHRAGRGDGSREQPCLPHEVGGLFSKCDMCHECFSRSGTQSSHFTETPWVLC